MKLYHATYKYNLASIQENGLIRNGEQVRAYPNCSNEYTYLSSDPECAISFAECSKAVPEKWIEEIVLLEVNHRNLDHMLFFLDENITNEARFTSFQYKGDIPAQSVSESRYMTNTRPSCLSCSYEFLNKCPTLKANSELQEIWKAREKKQLPYMDAWLKEHEFKKMSLCPEYRSKFIQYPLEITGIDFPESHSTDSFSGKVGSLVKIRPCGDEKTYLGLFLGDIPIGVHVSHNRETGRLSVGNSSNPAIFVPDLKKIVFGMESWWGIIKAENDLQDITDLDIESQWYVKAMKQIMEGNHES